ncbi:MAG: hypothetical protein PWP23_635 [Candidatus Sumerlaeota bacterium]|nr:hypothetical protein [Candidatus Sumerlaeota bacterium]
MSASSQKTETSSGNDYLVAVPNWVRVVDGIALALVVAILAGGFASEGYIANLEARGWAFAGCALLGIWGVVGWTMGRWSGAPRAASRWIAYAGLAAVIWTGVQTIPLSRERVTAISPVWQQVEADFAEAGVPMPERIPIAHSPVRSRLSWNHLVALLGFYLGVATLATRRGSTIVLLVVLCALTVAEGAFGAYTFLVKGVPRAYGAAWNPSHHAALTLMGIPVLVAALLELRRQIPRYSDAILSGRNPLILLFFLVGVALLGWGAGLSRASIMFGLLVLTGWGVLELWAALKSSGERTGLRGLWRLAGGGLVVIVLLCGAVLLLVLAAVPEGVAHRGFSADPAMLTRRVDFWRASVEALRETPWLGLGPAGTEHALTRFVHVPTFKNPVHSHNDYVQSVAELGIPAAAVVLVLLLVGAVLLLRDWRNQRRVFDWEERLLRRACGAGVLTILLHTLVDFPLRIPLVGFVFLILLALVVNPGPLLVAGYARRR